MFISTGRAVQIYKITSRQHPNDDGADPGCSHGAVIGHQQGFMIVPLLDPVLVRLLVTATVPLLDPVLAALLVMVMEPLLDRVLVPLLWS